MITIKSEYELSLMRIAGRIVYDTHQYIKDYIKPELQLVNLINLLMITLLVEMLLHHVLDMKDILLVYVYRLMRK